MQSAYVEVVVDGKPFDAVETVSVEAGQAKAARSCSIVCATKGGAANVHALFASGKKLEIRERGELVFKGFVERRQAQLQIEGTRITVSGQAKGIDAVDSSGKHKTGRFEKKTPLDIAKELVRQTGIDVEFKADVDLDKVPEHQIQPGATIFREIERLCRDQGKTLRGEADGSITLTDASKAKRSAGGLFEGVNIKSASADHNDSARHDQIVVRGQTYDNHGPDAMQVEATATDSEVGRKRPLIIAIDRNTDKDRSKKHAKNHRDKAAGRSRTASVVVVGWRDDGGNLYAPGLLKYVESETLGLAQDMLIEGVTFHQSGGEGEGSTTTLKLCDPRAHGGKKPKVSKSGSEWSQDDSEAS